MKRVLFGLFVVTLMVAGCGKQVPVTVSNDLEIWDIEEVYIYGGAEKGANLMAESGEITVAPGTYNILAVDDEGGKYSWSGVVIGDSGYTLNVTPADRDGYEETIEIGGEYYTGEGDAVVSITNDLGDWTIWWVYVVEEGEGFWDDRLQTYFLYPGETISVLVDPGVYDIQVEDEDGDTYTLWGVDVDGSGYDWSVTLDYLDSYDYTYGAGEGICAVDIYNGLGDWTIWYVYVDLSSNPWGDDRLGSEILEPGELFTVWVDPGTYDIKVEDQDGDTYTLWDVVVNEAGFYWEVTLADID